MSWTFAAPATSSILGTSMLSTAQKYLIGALLVALVATGLGWFIHTAYLRADLALMEGKIQEQSGQILKLTSSLELATEANKKLAHDVEIQNEAIQQYVDAAFKATENAKAAMAQAKLDGEKWKKKYEKLLNSPPANPSDECQSLGLRFDQYLELRSEK